MGDAFFTFFGMGSSGLGLLGHYGRVDYKMHHTLSLV